MDLLKGGKKRRKKGKKGGKKRSWAYGYEFKLRAVKLYLEEGVPIRLICRDTGVSKGTLQKWVKSYRERGEGGLRLHPRYRNRGTSLPAPVKDKIVSIKREHPSYGIRRISQILRRIFFLKASPETVRRTLQKEQLIGPPVKRKSRRNPAKPRFFERSTPNQMWQGDIFSFRLGGRNAYLIGYIDDYSRYVVGLDLFRSQTAEHVIEVYRRAVAESNPPKEMLTDNGRQYTNWRGTSRFEGELKKDRVHHIRSRPHHPMTLGKIERFWKTIFQEFLVRAQFGSFEEARERVGWWVRYYNHKRPHQGIGGLCPADRYFEIQTELKKTIERGIQENVLEMALRGKPRSPFYMVGRMEGQSVVLRAEKGKLRLTVDDDEGQETEMIYNLGEKDNHEEEDHEQERREDEDHQEQEDGYLPDGNGECPKESEQGEPEIWSGGEVPGGLIGLDGEKEAGGGLPGAGYPVHGLKPLAEPGPGGDAAGVRAPGPVGPGPGLKPEVTGVAREAELGDRDQEGLGETGGAAGPDSGGEGNEEIRFPAESLERKGGGVGRTGREGQEGEGPAPGPGDLGGPERSNHGPGGGQAPGGVPEDLLPVGEKRSGRDDQGDRGAGIGPPPGASGLGERGAEKEGGGSRAGGGDGQAVGGGAEDPYRVRGPAPGEEASG